MCTPGKDQSTTIDANKNALCVLSGIQIPLRVEVLGPGNQEAQLNTWRLQLCKEDRKIVKEGYSSAIQDCPYEYDIVVPENFLVTSISFHDVDADKSKRLKNKVLGDYYYSCTLANANLSDIVAWAPPLRYDRHTELIPCILYFAGVDMLKPSRGYAFVCPLTSIHESFLGYKMDVPRHTVRGWGKVFKVPITDIYRWEDINIKRLPAQTEFTLDATKLSPDELGGRKTYTFVYKYSATDHKTVGKSSDLKELDKEMSNLKKAQKSLDGEISSETKGKPQPVKRKTIGERQPSSAKRTDTVAEPTGGSQRNEIQNDQLHDVSREPDDRSQIPAGSVGNAKRQFSKEEFPELRKTNHSSSSSRDTKRRSNIEYDDNNIILFGKCFVKAEQFEKVFIKEIECGDMVVATPKDHDDILGQVGLICKIPSIRQEQIFVGVEFEDKIKVNPFEVRHIWEDENICQDSCGDGKYIFIPMEFLLERPDYPSSEKRLRVLKNTAVANKKNNKGITSTSDVHVDFQYEAARRDFLQSPLEFTELSSGKLKHMGIQGNANSCYIDAVLFAIYGFTANFDDGLLKQQSYNKRKDDQRMKLEAARNLLKYDIVTPLRLALKVDWVHVYKLRRALADILNDKSYLGNFMDAEHFIANLFATVLQVPEFIEIGEDTKEYVLQLFPPVTPEGQEKVDRPSVQYLLQEYCNWADIKLRTMPQTGFIIKLPVCDGISEYKVVYPNLELNLDKLLDKKDQAKNTMTLRSVICLKKNHFTCFVRTISKPESFPSKYAWLFHDSMAPELGEPILTECEGLEEALQLVAPIFNYPSKKTDSSSLSKEEKIWIDRLLSTAYICVYEPYRSTLI